MSPDGRFAAAETAGGPTYVSCVEGAGRQDEEAADRLAVASSAGRADDLSHSMSRRASNPRAQSQIQTPREHHTSHRVPARPSPYRC